MAQIDIDILIAYGAAIQKVKKGEFIFHEGSDPHYFFQVIEGSIKMISLNQEGKEFIQGIFDEGCSFGEPPLIAGEFYPSSAMAMKDSVIIKLSKEKLSTLMNDRPSITVSLLECFARRIHKKALISKILNCNDPEEKIMAFLDNYKNEQGFIDTIKIPYTRQQIADSTGLCVETVIRTLIKMSEGDKVEINHHKVYY